MLNSALFNEITYNGTRTRFPIYKLGAYPFLQWGYVSKVLSSPFDIAVITLKKIRVFLAKKPVRIRTKTKFF